MGFNPLMQDENPVKRMDNEKTSIVLAGGPDKTDGG
jgi:hypothetical protein